MDEFTKFWNITRPGLHCFMICDNLRTHRNNEIFRKAFLNGIHMFYIMPGSSHWMQVHDQLPFATLKKSMAAQKNSVLPIDTLPRDQRRKLFMAMFYQAERKALAKHVLLKSFADVGLKPFDPAKIFANCAEQTPSQCSVYYTEATNELISAIKEQTRKRV